MGLGFSSAVAAKTKYPTIVDNMVTQGVIDHPTFSLYFNGLDSKNGSVLFGGVDSGKYYDTLATLPLRTPPNVTDASASVYAVSLKGLAVSGVSLPAVANDSIAILDSGSTMSLIPDSAASAVGKKYGVVTISYQGASTPPFVDCAYSGEKGKNSAVKFSFEGKDIYVPIKEMVVNAIPDEVQRMIKDPSVQGVPSAMRNWDSACLWGIASAEAYGVKSSQFYLLGDTFLRSAYAVYDMSNKKIGLAQANLNSTQSNVIEIAKDATTLPTAAGAKGKFPAAVSVATLRANHTSSTGFLPNQRLKSRPRHIHGFAPCGRSRGMLDAVKMKFFVDVCCGEHNMCNSHEKRTFIFCICSYLEHHTLDSKNNRCGNKDFAFW